MDQVAQHNGIYPRLFALPKPGNSEEQYEDAYAGDAARGIYAIADGASDSVFAGVWARLLVHHLLGGFPPPGDEAAWLRPAQAAWQMAAQAEPLPWYVEAKVHAGAFATCLGLQLLPPEQAGAPGQWTAVAVGDCCLFHVQISGAAGVVPPLSAAAYGFPCTTPADFNQHPLALSTNPERNEEVWPHLATASGTWAPGDTFILATDSMALWIAEAIVPQQAWHHLLRLSETADDTAFHQLIAALRDENALRADDLTLLLLHTGQPVEERPVEPTSVAVPPPAMTEALT